MIKIYVFYFIGLSLCFLLSDNRCQLSCPVNNCRSNKGPNVSFLSLSMSHERFAHLNLDSNLDCRKGPFSLFISHQIALSADSSFKTFTGGDFDCLVEALDGN